MSNEVKKAERTIPEIQVEYSNLCTRAGHLQYEINAKSKDLELLNSTLRDLNFEAAAANSKAQQAAAEAQKAVEPDPKPKRQRKER